MNDLPPPVALALIVADEVTIDPATGKPTARGIFFNLDTPLPLRFDFSVFVTITEVRRPAHPPDRFASDLLGIIGDRSASGFEHNSVGLYASDGRLMYI